MKIIFVLLALGVSLVASKSQSIAIKGRFLCRNKPAQYVELELYDYGWFSNTVLAKDIVSDPGGYFYIAGYRNTWFKDIDAWLKIRHRCYEHAYEHHDPCSLQFEVDVPMSQVYQDYLPKGFWQFAEISLDKQISGEKRVCP